MGFSCYANRREEEWKWGDEIKSLWKSVLGGLLLYVTLVYYFLPDMRLSFVALLAILLVQAAQENKRASEYGHPVSWKTLLLFIAVGLLLSERNLHHYFLAFATGVTVGIVCILVRWNARKQIVWRRDVYLSMLVTGLLAVLLCYMLVLPFPSVPAWLIDCAALVMAYICPLGPICFLLASIPSLPFSLNADEKKLILFCGAFVGLFGVQLSFASFLVGFVLYAGKRRLCRS